MTATQKQAIEYRMQNAFRHFVRDWKQQNPDTCTFDDHIYSYQAYNGDTKFYKAMSSWKEYRNSEFHGKSLFTTDGFIFCEIVKKPSEKIRRTKNEKEQ